MLRALGPAMAAAIVGSVVIIIWSAVREIKAMEKEFGGRQD